MLQAWAKSLGNPAAIRCLDRGVWSPKSGQAECRGSRNWFADDPNRRQSRLKFEPSGWKSDKETDRRSWQANSL